jgi:hypothetical protein
VSKDVRSDIESSSEEEGEAARASVARAVPHNPHSPKAENGTNGHCTSTQYMNHSGW